MNLPESNSNPLPTQPVSEDSPRIRFAKREIVKILTALEMVDGSDLDLGIRVLRLEDQLTDERELTKRWRRSYEGLAEIIAMSSDDRLKRLDELAREWVGRA